MEQTVASWLAQFGAPALFGLLTLGVFGLPIPDETVLVVAGVLVSHGQLRAAPVAAAGVGGALTGITVSYVLGRFAGLPLLLRYGAVIHVSQPLLARVGQWFGRFGKWLLTVGYFIPGVRHVTAMIAGASGLSGWTFSLFVYSGAIAWVLCFLSIGYVVGDEWRTFLFDLHWRIILLSAAAVAIWIAHMVRAVRSGRPPD